MKSKSISLIKQFITDTWARRKHRKMLEYAGWAMKSHHDVGSRGLYGRMIEMEIKRKAGDRK